MDALALRVNIARWNESGIAGYVALGSTGERVHLDERERLEVIDAARAIVPPSLTFIVGVGQQSTRATTDEARRAAQSGADAVLALPPHYYRAAMTAETLIKYFVAVADASPVPLLLYHIPQFTGVALPPDAVERLSGHENIIGIKDSSGDIINLTEIVRRVPEDFAVMTGSGAVLFAALCAGACGAILAAACVAPQLTVQIFRAVMAGDFRRAQALQRKLTPLARAVTSRYGISGLKTALDLCGYAGGTAVRLPLETLGEDARREIEQLLVEHSMMDEEIASGVEADAATAIRGAIL